MSRINPFVGWMAAALLLMDGGPTLAGTTEAETAARVAESFGKWPLLFIENRGQFDSQVGYVVQGTTTTLYFTPGGVTFALHASSKETLPSPEGGLIKTALQSRHERWVVKLDFLGANPDVKPRAEAPQDAVISYFTGPDDQWRTGLKTYGQLRYPDLWPGIDLVYSGTVNRLKYHFEVKPGADPKQIRLAYRGARSVTATDAGQLQVVTPVQTFQDDRPVAWQEVEGRRVEVNAAYALEPGNDESQPYGFRLGTYDPHRPLVLDPAVLVYAGFVGGGSDEYGYGIAVDAAGNAYVTGETRSADGVFPVKVGPDLSYNGNWDAFVAKVRADGATLVYAGYLGGNGSDVGQGIAVDAVGNAYMTGYTSSTEATFPVKVGPDLTHNGRNDAFVAKVNAAGTGLIYAGYVGGWSDDYGYGIAVDAVGNAYLTGYTNSTEGGFPVKIGPDLTHNGGEDAFVAKVNAAGSSLVYAGFIGGNGRDYGRSIAVDAAGNAYITGGTNSTERGFPVKVGPDLTYNGAYWDAFVAKINTTGAALTYAGYLGGSGEDYGRGIAVDAAGSAYVTGSTRGFPVRVGPDVTYNGQWDAFVAKVKTDGTDFIYAGYIGGGADDYGNSIAVDAAGNAYVTGQTQSNADTFPVRIGPDLTFNGYWDAFVAKVNAAGVALVYAGYLGGNNADYGRAVAVDAAGNAYITGETTSRETTFPVKIGPDITYNGGNDAFVAKIGAEPVGRGDWYLDANGNGVWNGTPTDRFYLFGSAGDVAITGDWNGDGKDEIGFRRGAVWYLDYNGNGVWEGAPADRIYTFGSALDLPIVGDWNGDGRDNIGVKRGAAWILDYNGNGVWNGAPADRLYTFGQLGDVPVAGDWNGDNRDEIGFKRGAVWYLDYNGNGVWNGAPTDRAYTFGSALDQPVVGNWNNDPRDEIGFRRVRQ